MKQYSYTKGTYWTLQVVRSTHTLQTLTVNYRQRSVIVHCL
uniref:Uncharacterized protein n=1 Tax=Anguilla anguilla TaxID=7936 RepID=A0A0E9WC89_ANGAN